ncbi:MAG: RimK family alpha-L-glutamate ligase [Hirschia sp.]|nr:RimK family alpha-L-glutamate ligase [Hirschia sp.]MBF17848.1 RimK family alpha-L-glutamate ligase [Hirschia sp.]
MSDWLVLVEQASDLAQTETPHKVMTLGDYLAHPDLFAGRRPSLINLARSYNYQSRGYYASLLAEARGHRVIPSVQTMVQLGAKTLYEQSLPELNVALARDLEKGAEPATTLLIAFGKAQFAGYERFSRLLADWFRTPVLEVTISQGAKPEVSRLKPVSFKTLKDDRRAFALEAMEAYTRGRWSDPRQKTPSRWSLAVLIDPAETMPPSDEKSLKSLSRVAEKMGVSVEPIYPGDLAKLAEYDALFIRATTQIDNFTYRFATRAEQEGMPVIDDTMSMIRCTNKVYLKEILAKAGLPSPKSEIFDARAKLDDIALRIGLPLVLKAPDGSFSRQVHKVKTLDELTSRAREMFEDTALLLAQEFMPTNFDWRIVVLGGKPLIASQYKMARGHWQIIKHGENGKFEEGGFATFRIEDAPSDVVELGVKAARLIGDGLYGVDIKQNDSGVFIIEINDNPNLTNTVEGAVIKDEMWKALIEWYAARLEKRMGGAGR